MFPACEERISQKYGKWGRTLGKGTGGTVRLIQGPPRTGGKVFAVKEFRKKKNKETDFEYRRMIAAECCYANGLKHVNVIETVDIVRNKSRYFQVMEYAPYDLFSVVMSGKMIQPEIYCVFRQICDGVAYLHSTGLAHRDLKLENCVMTGGNVVKLIDFGTATPSFHPDKGVILSSGLVGSDPYVAPEVVRGEMYDARRADVWSAGIIFVAMMLRRFPWALADPRKDLNYRKFASTLHELPARPRSPLTPRKAPPSPTRMTSSNGSNAMGNGNGNGIQQEQQQGQNKPLPPTPGKTRPANGHANRQKSGDEGFDSSASSAYDIPAPSLFGPGEGSITTFATADSSLVLTPSDTGGSAHKNGEMERERDDSSAHEGGESSDAAASSTSNWVDEPRLESYENWEEVIERLCAERSESEASSSRSSMRSGGGSFMSRRTGSGSANGNGNGREPGLSIPQYPGQMLSPPNGYTNGYPSGLAPPKREVRREASEPALGMGPPGVQRPGQVVPNRVPRPAISTHFSDRPMLGEGLSTSPLGLAPASAPGRPSAEHLQFAASSPSLPRPLAPPMFTSLSTPTTQQEQRVVISPDNTLSYLPAETRWTILRMLQIEPQSRCSMADLLYAIQLPPTPPLTPGRQMNGLEGNGNAHPSAQEKTLPSGLQMTPARRSATAPVVPSTVPRRRNQDPSIEELGRDWLRGVVPCSKAPPLRPGEKAREGWEGCGDHVHVRLKTGKEKDGSSSGGGGGGKWWKKS